jgi:flagellin
MSFRINTNTQSALALNQLSQTTNEIGQRQLRLASGSKINSAADDSAGFTISNKLQATTRGQAQALSNIGDAKSMLTVAEGALSSTMDILQTMKEKAVQAGNSSMGTEERAAIQSQVDALAAEVNDILGGANFNGTQLFDDTAETSLSFQVGDKAGDTFGASIGQLGIDTLGIGTVAGVGDVTTAADASASVSAVSEDTGSDLAASDITISDGTGYVGSADRNIVVTASAGTNAGTLALTYTDSQNNEQTIDNLSASDAVNIDGIQLSFNGDLEAADTFTLAAVAAVDAVSVGDVTADLDLTTDSGVANALSTIDSAISKVNETASGLGDVQNRLDFKAQNLETSKTNYEAANSRIADADFAKEQMEIVKLQILQQTGSAMFAQSNASGQSVLSFF